MLSQKAAGSVRQTQSYRSLIQIVEGEKEMAKVLYGKPVVDSIKGDLIGRIKNLKVHGVAPGLAILRAGERPDDIAYEQRLSTLCESLGIRQRTMEVDRSVSQYDLLDALESLNRRDDVHGIIVFRPLPDHIDDDVICDRIYVDKDIDCMNPDNLKGLFTGRRKAFAPCTAEAVIELLDFYGYNLDGANVVIINRSLVVGKPLTILMLGRNATVMVCHSHTKNIKAITRSADILITGTGIAEYLGPDYVSSKTVVIDVGINFTEDGRMTGDVDFEAVCEKAAAVTPVPKGIGGVTSAILLRHIIESAERYIW